jgi:hypothetical protein
MMTDLGKLRAVEFKRPHDRVRVTLEAQVPQPKNASGKLENLEAGKKK